MSVQKAYTQWVAQLLQHDTEGVFFTDGQQYWAGLGAATEVDFTDGNAFVTPFLGGKYTAYVFENYAENLSFTGPTHDIKNLPSLEISAVTPYLQTTKKAYMEGVSALKNAAHAGEIWVANLCHVLRGELPDERALLGAYGRFLQNNTGPHVGGVLWTKKHTFASFSPELFLRQSGNTVTTKPIKGTGTQAYLQKSEKEKAELHMVTDLLRNDLGQICDRVWVKKEREITPLHGFFHAHADIRGRLENTDINWEKYAKILPAGSITGAPKYRVLQHIHALEVQKRGLYTGTFGVKTNAGMLSNILIRTLFKDGQNWTYGTGAGITHDSDPTAEWNETLQKAEILTRIS